MEWKLIWICFCVVSKMAFVAGQTPTLNANSTSVCEQQTVELICEHSPTDVVSWWLGNGLVTTAAANNGVCDYSSASIPYIFAECSCGNSRHSCTLKPLSMSNNGEVWTCSITDPATTNLFRSNTQTLAVKAIPTTPMSWPTQDYVCADNWTIVCTFGTIALILGCSCVLILPCVVFGVYLTFFYKDGVRNDGERKIAIIAIVIFWDGIWLIGCGLGLILHQESGKGLPDGNILASLILGCLGAVVLIAVIAIAGRECNAERRKRNLDVEVIKAEEENVSKKGTISVSNVVLNNFRKSPQTAPQTTPQY